VKIKGNKKYEFYSIQLQCHSTSHSTRPNPTKPKDGLNPCPSLGRRDALTLLHNCSNKLHNKFTTNQSSGIRASRTCSVYVRPAMTHRLSQMWSISRTVDEFVDNTNRFVWRNLQCKVWDKVSEGSTAVMATSEFPFIIAKATRYIIGERNLVCQTPARSFSHFDKISACGRRTGGRTDRHMTTA